MAKQEKKPRKSTGKPSPGRLSPGTLNFPVVGIGASAGGLDAFTKLLEHLPADTGMVFVLIQHLDPNHESLLPSLLSRATAMPVVEIKQRAQLKPNHVFVGPPNASVALKGNTLMLKRRPGKGQSYMPIDRFLLSLAEDLGNRAIGIILSGTACDGTAGLRAIRAAGGITVAQDERSAKFDGMPRNAIAAGVVDYVLRPEEIGRELARIRRHPFMAPDPLHKRVEETAQNELSKIFDLLRARTGADFARYKRGTIERRLRRRMALARTEQVADYIRVLQQDRDEVHALYEDFLINVTDFFRDTKVFDLLKNKLFPRLLRERDANSGIRIWTPGCSTGQETYSIAMLLIDYLSEHGLSHQVQVFGTDLSTTAVRTAREGIYSELALKNVPPSFLRRYFTKMPEGYRVSKRIREVCVFARQDLGKDPPFSRMDLISCRNVLIYLGEYLRNRLIPMFHYALKPNGYLMLGKAEMVVASSLFGSIDKSQRIYQKKPGDKRPAVDTRGSDFRSEFEARNGPENKEELDLQKEADRMVLARYAPPGVVINPRMEILQFRGDMSRYMRPTAGPATLNSLKMLREDIAADLHSAIELAARENAPVRRERLRLEPETEGSPELDIEVLPIAKAADGECQLLVLFEKVDRSHRESQFSPETAGAAAAAEIARLQTELATSRKHLKLLMDERQASEEELQSANEEILSNNEELQSANEELETSQEELQSANQELTTVNDELQSQNAELGRLGNDLLNLLHNVNIGIVMMSNDLQVRRFTPTATRVLNLRPADVGRPIMEIKSNLEIPDLERLLTGVVEDLTPRELDVQDRNGTWYSLRVRPYRTEDHKIDGVVMALYDIDQIKQSLNEVRRARDFSEAVVDTIPGPLLILDAGLKVVIANRSFYDTYQLTKGRTVGMPLSEIGGGEFNIAPLQQNLRRAISKNLGFEAIEVEGQFHRIGRRILSVSGRFLGSGDDRKMLLILSDVSKQIRSERQMQKAHSKLQISLQTAESSLRESETDLRQSRTELRALTARLLASQEEERRRVSRELHDDLNQRMAMLEVDVEQLVGEIPKSSALVQSGRSLRSRLADVTNDIRRVAYELHPSILDHLGLAVALRSYCSEFSKREKIRVQLSTKGAPEPVPEAIALCLYRVAQEGLRNVAKHASAKSVRVRLQKMKNRIQLSIQDDGAGFDPSAHKQGRGIGLLSMKERMRHVDGEFKLTSKIGEGTRVEVWAPLPQGSLVK